MAYRVQMSEAKISAKATHFFTMIVPENLKDGKLMIPRGFVQRHGECLMDFAFLKLPNGAEWKVSLTKCNGQVWLQDGWKEFAEYHSLAYGQLMVFRYEGTCQFQVLIFDMSALEVDYPFNDSNNEQWTNLNNDQGCHSGEPEGSTESEESVENILHEVPTGMKRRGKSFESFLHRKKMRINGGVETQSLINLKNTTKEKKIKKSKVNTDSNKKATGIVPTLDQLKSKKVKRKRTWNSKSRATALEKASAFKSENPFFLTVMQPSLASAKSYITIPYRFVERHLNPVKKEGIVILRIPQQKDWHVKYTVKYSKAHRKMKLTIGRKEFIKENEFKVGDVCVFELVERTATVFEVHIFRIAESPSCTLSQGTTQMHGDNQGWTNWSSEVKTETTTIGNVECSTAITAKELQCSARNTRFESRELRQNSKEMLAVAMAFDRSSHWDSSAAAAFTAASKFSSYNPFSIVNIRASHLQKCLPVRKDFLESCLIHSGMTVMLQVGFQTWSVKFLLYPYKSTAWLSAGWSKFAEENHLEAGDSCVLELIRREDPVLKVIMFRRCMY